MKNLSINRIKTPENSLVEIINKNTKSIIGRPDCKELKERSFIKDFFLTFAISLKGKNESETKIRCKLQEVIECNVREAIGDFHNKELNKQELINDIFKFFELKPKQNEV